MNLDTMQTETSIVHNYNNRMLLYKKARENVSLKRKFRDRMTSSYENIDPRNITTYTPCVYVVMLPFTVAN